MRERGCRATAQRRRLLGALLASPGHRSAGELAADVKNWGLPIRHHSHFSGIGYLNLPAPLLPAMRVVAMRTGALGWLALITQIPGHASIAAAARAYAGRDSALCQKVRKIETAAGFTIIDRHLPHARSARPRVPPRSAPDPPGRPGNR